MTKIIFTSEIRKHLFIMTADSFENDKMIATIHYDLIEAYALYGNLEIIRCSPSSAGDFGLIFRVIDAYSRFLLRGDNLLVFDIGDNVSFNYNKEKLLEEKQATQTLCEKNNNKIAFLCKDFKIANNIRLAIA